MRIPFITLKNLGTDRYVYVVEIIFVPAGQYDGYIAPKDVVVLMDGTSVKFSDKLNRTGQP